MVAEKPKNKQVGSAPEKKETVDEREFRVALENAKAESKKPLLDGCAWVTYKGISPERAQPSISIVNPTDGRQYRFFRDVKRQLGTELAGRLTKTNKAFKLEG